jgi:signal peptidase I
MNLDNPFKIVTLVCVLVLLRIVWGVWRSAPARRFMVELLDSGLIAFLLVFVIIRPFVVQAFYIPSGSMEPTFLEGDRILVNRFVYRLNQPQRGDILVFVAPDQALDPRDEFQAPGQARKPQDDKKDFVKRLIGLPGDRIHVVAEVGVFVNGHLLREPPGAAMPEYNWPADELGNSTGKDYTVPQGCYLVLGDNRNLSRDSHVWANRKTGEAEPYLEANRVLGKAMVIFWPPSRIHLVSDNRDVGLVEEPVVAERMTDSPSYISQR